jgi:hypothetical protein
LRVTDANASGMAIRVGRIHQMLADIKAAGGRVLSRNGELVEWSATVRNVFVKDPNGFNIELVGSADPTQRTRHRRSTLTGPHDRLEPRADPQRPPGRRT